MLAAPSSGAQRTRTRQAAVRSGSVAAMRGADLVVIGGGVAGLAAARTAERLGATALVLEAAGEPGGVARSVRTGGYVFDCCGHVLHLARPATRSLVASVTPWDEWREVERRSAVWMRDRLVPYPFQLHLAHAPADVRDECLSTLPDVARPLEGDPAAVRFTDWIDAALGAGIGRHFMIPYNEKVAGVPASELTCAWLGRFVPQPTLDEIRAGAASRRVVRSGYNRRFLYPRRGGIDLLAHGLAAGLGSVETRARVRCVDTATRTLTLESGARVVWGEALCSTVPLPEMCAMTVPGSPALAACTQLRASAVTCVNLGLRRLAPAFRELHWVYLPERRFRAYRVGFYGRLSAASAPPGREGVYVEIAHGAGAREETLAAAAVADLIALGAIRRAADVEVVASVRVPHAYVVHDARHASARGRILRDLADRGVHMIGRWGSWEYGSIEDALWQGITTAERVLGGSGTWS